MVGTVFSVLFRLSIKRKRLRILPLTGTRPGVSARHGLPRMIQLTLRDVLKLSIPRRDRVRIMASPRAKISLWRHARLSKEQNFCSVKLEIRAGFRTRQGRHASLLRHNIFKRLLSFKESQPGNASAPSEPTERCTVRKCRASPNERLYGSLPNLSSRRRSVRKSTWKLQIPSRASFNFKGVRWRTKKATPFDEVAPSPVAYAVRTGGLLRRV